MENLKPNSHKYKEQQSTEQRKKLDKIVSGTVKTKKKSGFRKFAGELISNDVPSVKTYIVKDVIIPTIKKVITETIDMFLYGSSRRDRTTSVNRVSYRQYYDEPRIRDNVPTRHGYSYDNIVLEDRGEAERVISQMNDLIETYERVSVADLYDLVGLSSNYTDNDYGWTNIRNAEAVRVRDGYELRLPRVLPLK